MIARLREILESKRQMRRGLAALPIPEKLRMLDELRERAVEISKAREAAKRRKG